MCGSLSMSEQFVIHARLGQAELEHGGSHERELVLPLGTTWPYRGFGKRKGLMKGIHVSEDIIPPAGECIDQYTFASVSGWESSAEVASLWSTSAGVRKGASLVVAYRLVCCAT